MYAAMWMKLENIMLRMEPDTKVCILYDYIYMNHPETGKFIVTESRVMIAWGWGEEELGSDCSVGTRSPWEG